MITKKIVLKLKGFVLLPICFFITIQAMAQTGTLRGSVKDANGLPLAGASVVLKGTNKGTTTNTIGDYSLQVAPGTYILVISYVGTVAQRKEVNVIANGVTQTDFDMISSGELTQVIVGSRSPTARTRIQTPVPVDLIQISQVVNDIGQVELSQILNFI